MQEAYTTICYDVTMGHATSHPPPPQRRKPFCGAETTTVVREDRTHPFLPAASRGRAGYGRL